MNFELSEEQRLIQDTARRFAAEQIAPTLEEEERKHEFRADRVAKMGALGFFSCALPEEYGGSGMGFMESVLMAEQIARVSASWRLPFNMQNLGPALTVAKFGTEQQKKKFVPGWVAGTQLGFFGIDELGISCSSAFLLQWQGYEIAKSTRWHEVLIGEQSVVANKINLGAEIHGFSE